MGGPAVDRRAGIGWDELLRQVPEAAERAWVSIAGDPRRLLLGPVPASLISRSAFVSSQGTVVPRDR